MGWKDVISRNTTAEALKKVAKSGAGFYPAPENIFKAFNMVSPEAVRIVLVGQDPYPDSSATGLLFANNKDTNEDQLSPSLKIIKSSFVKLLQNSEKELTFDPSLEYLPPQGVLMLNSALTVEKGVPESHSLIWRKFTSELLCALADLDSSIIFVLFGKQAQSFTPYIGYKNRVFMVMHPAYYARQNLNKQEEGIQVYKSLWEGINDLLACRGRKLIEWI